MLFSPSWILYLLSAVVSAASLPSSNGNVHLAIKPKCGSFGGSPLDVGSTGGLKTLSSYTDIVVFGDAYSDAGQHGDVSKPISPAVLSPPNPSAGGRNSNGPVWAELFAAKHNATLHDFAIAGSVIDASEWDYLVPGKFSSQQDLIAQVNNWWSATPKRSDPETSLYVLFAGIEDYDEATDLNHWQRIRDIAEGIVYQMTVLMGSGPATDFLIIDNTSRGNSTGPQDFQDELFMSLGLLRENYPGTNVGFVNLNTLWDGILINPGYEAFGYTSPGQCLAGSGNTTVGACSDPDHTFYWSLGTPSKVTHSLIADYVEQVMSTC